MEKAGSVYERLRGCLKIIVILSEAEESTFNEVDQPIPLTPDRPVLLRTEGLIRHPLRFLGFARNDIWGFGMAFGGPGMTGVWRVAVVAGDDGCVVGFRPSPGDVERLPQTGEGTFERGSSTRLRCLATRRAFCLWILRRGSGRQRENVVRYASAMVT